MSNRYLLNIISNRQRKIVARSILSAAIFWLCPMDAFSGPIGEPVLVTSVRPYTTENPIGFLTVSLSSLCGTSAFSIHLGEPGGKEMYAAILTALALNKKVMLEVSNSTGCTGWGTLLQSVSLLNE